MNENEGSEIYSWYADFPKELIEFAMEYTKHDTLQAAKLLAYHDLAKRKEVEVEPEKETPSPDIITRLQQIRCGTI